MLKFGGAAILMPDDKSRIKFLAGKSDGEVHVRPFIPYADIVCEFLSNLSIDLLSDKSAKYYPDVISFAYWCRKSNITKLKQEFVETYARLGLGLVFHISPSNVPINFAFSYVFALLAGNANIVRVPTKDFPQTHVVCNVINKLFADEKYKNIADMTTFVQYSQNDEITRSFSSRCNARIIWGGDQTIKNIRKLAMPARSIEIAFADRYSLSVIDGNSVSLADNETLKNLAVSFFNDTYLMDQNACSSPSLIVWVGEKDLLTDAKERFWDSVYKVAKNRYELQPVNAVDKYMQLCENAIVLNNIKNTGMHGNYLYRVELDELNDNIHELRGKCGYFYEYSTSNINSIAHIINTKYQTLTYFGLDKSQLLDFVVRNRLSGIDRIVPIGSALDIGVIWDGYDIVRSLSRIISCK